MPKNMRAILVVVGGAVFGPAMGLLVAVQWLDAALGISVSPNWVVGGGAALVLAAIFVLKRYAQKFFDIVDEYPKMVITVAQIQRDVEVIRKNLEITNHLERRMLRVESKLGLETEG